ncbi:MAG: response regulator [Nitrospirae bacterium]|nr:response regulator [Nitrospirota bacterium]
MRILIAEDDFTSRTLLQHFLSPYGECDVTVNGMEAVEAFMLAVDEGQPYDLICLDIMMPELDGIKALKAIRDKERDSGVASHDEVKVVMTTALDSPKDVIEAYYRGGCTDYLTKPIDTQKLLNLLKGYGLIGK